jgi:hypothetical protein
MKHALVNSEQRVEGEGEISVRPAAGENGWPQSCVVFRDP